LSRTSAPSEAFVDTSALIAALVEGDRYHRQAVRSFESLFQAQSLLITTNYVALETSAVLHTQIGFSAALTFHEGLLPALDVAWVDEDLHRRGLIAWRTAGRRALSLVDCVSFELMRELRIDQVLTFDRHFGEQGFALISPAD
jgi:predicted nucleic acid-binding protein